MSLTSRVPDNDSDDFQQVSSGTHVGVCFRLIDIGTQYSEMYDSHARKVIIGFEVPEETDSEGKPLIVHGWVTNSLSKKATLRQWLEAWRAKPFTKEELQGFDLTQIIGKGCLLNIGETEKGRAKISAIMALPKGTSAPKLYNSPHIFDMETGKLEEQPDWVQERVKESEEFKGPKQHFNEPQAISPQADIDDDIPF